MTELKIADKVDILFEGFGRAADKTSGWSRIEKTEALMGHAGALMALRNEIPAGSKLSKSFEARLTQAAERISKTSYAEVAAAFKLETV